VPSIAQLLASAGAFTDRALKRYDDTDLLISPFAENGYDSAVGRAAIRRMNQIQGRFHKEGVTVLTPVKRGRPRPIDRSDLVRSGAVFMDNTHK
jgi:hypothetical protein